MVLSQTLRQALQALQLLEAFLGLVVEADHLLQASGRPGVLAAELLEHRAPGHDLLQAFRVLLKRVDCLPGLGGRVGELRRQTPKTFVQGCQGRVPGGGADHLAQAVEHLLLAGQAFVGGLGGSPVRGGLTEPLFFHGQPVVFVGSLQAGGVEFGDLVAQKIALTAAPDDVPARLRHGGLHLSDRRPGRVAGAPLDAGIGVEGGALRPG